MTRNVAVNSPLNIYYAISQGLDVFNLRIIVFDLELIIFNENKQIQIEI